MHDTRHFAEFAQGRRSLRRKVQRNHIGLARRFDRSL
jgi:hypothetical protein